MKKSQNCKTENIIFRVTKNEKLLLSQRAKAAGMTISKYIITISEHKRLVNPEPIVRLLIEVNRIGNNINQIARVANTQQMISNNQVEALNRQMEYLNKKVEYAMSLTFEQEKTVIPHSPDTIKYHLNEIESILYEILGNQEKTGSD